MEFHMKNVALITGASSGIGKEFAVQICRRYQKLDELWLIARRKERLTELAGKLPLPVKVIELDLTKPESKSEIHTLLSQESLQIRILINCAGFGKVGRVEQIKEEEQTEMIRLNCLALTFLCKECLPYMKRGSRIINMGSIASFFPVPEFAVYAATKAYVLSFSRALRAELKGRGIRVTVVCPGPVNTEFFKIAEETGFHAWYKELLLAEPQRVVAQALEDAQKGQEISIYGGGVRGLRFLAKLLPHRFLIWVTEFVDRGKLECNKDTNR